MVFIFTVLMTCTRLWAQDFDHTHHLLTSVLQKHTEIKDGQTWVNYSKLKTQSRQDLQNYLRALEGVSKDGFQKFNSGERLAFLINAYNAFTLEWILIHHPVKSIKDTGSLFRSPWKKTFPGFKLLGVEFTLDMIEHEWIRGVFNEPRIHFAVNCASQGCPSLRRNAFTGANLEKELAEVEKEFFLNPRHFKFSNNKAEVSSILKWYGDDFKKVFGSLESYLTKKGLELGVLTMAPQNLKIDFSDYDWALNGN